MAALINHLIDRKVCSDDPDARELLFVVSSKLEQNLFEELLGTIKRLRSDSFKAGYKRGEQDGRDAREIDEALKNEY